MERKAKKGQLSGMWLVILTLIVAAFCLVLGVELLVGFQDATDNYAGTKTSETGAYINSTGYLLASSRMPGFRDPTITLAVNSTNTTDAFVISSGNYTIVGHTLYNTSAKVWPSVNISYTFYYGTEAYRASNKSTIGVANFSDFWDIIVIAFVITLVIGLILWAVGGKRIK